MATHQLVASVVFCRAREGVWWRLAVALRAVKGGRYVPVLAREHCGAALQYVTMLHLSVARRSRYGLFICDLEPSGADCGIWC
jgi:hypothetical protein